MCAKDRWYALQLWALNGEAMQQMSRTHASVKGFRGAVGQGSEVDVGLRLGRFSHPSILVVGALGILLLFKLAPLAILLHLHPSASRKLLAMRQPAKEPDSDDD